MEEKLSQGDRLGRYRLLTELGRGGMASVWVALERAPGGAQRFVALKVMLPRLARLSAFRAMFLDEGQLVRSINHTSVVRVFEVGEDRGVLFMAMEWVEGDSLHTLIKEARKRRAVPPEMAVRMIADVAGGLHEAHELRGWDGELRGVVHCDVSPHNILIGLDGHAKLTDFGVAHAAAMSVAEREGAMMGKVGYMSPEQAFGASIDRRSDIFSLGVVLFELTTGKRLFGRKEVRETLELVQNAVVPPPTTVWPDYPQLLEPIVMRALAREPGRRYRTAEEFRRVLEQYLIETRTLVPAAGVGRLLTRVLGAKIAERREEVRAALTALREAAPRNAMLVAIPVQEAADPADRYLVTSPGSGSGSLPGATGATPEGPAESQTETTLGSEARWGDLTAAARPRALRHLWPWLVAGGAVVAAAAAVVVTASPARPAASAVVTGSSSPLPLAVISATASAAADLGEAEPVSIDRIPVAVEPTASPAPAARRPATPRPATSPEGAATVPARPGPETAPRASAAPPVAATGAIATASASHATPSDEDMDFLKKPAATRNPGGRDLGIENPYR